MVEKIAEEKKRLEDNKIMIESRGELLTNIRAALQNMSSMMVCVNPATAKPYGKTKDSKRSKTAEVEEKTTPTSEDDDKTKKVCGDPIEQEGTPLLTLEIYVFFFLPLILNDFV